MTKRGFTLIETIISILVVTVGVLAAYIVTQEIISYTHQVNSRFTAVYLAKEGIEIVRNIRDTNWLDAASPSWNDGLRAGDWEADYNDADLFDCPSPCDPNDPVNNPGFLQIAGGFYNYGSGSDTKFKRRIAIDDFGLPSPDKLKVTVEVWWEEKGEIYGPITVQEILYNWY